MADMDRPRDNRAGAWDDHKLAPVLRMGIGIGVVARKAQEARGLSCRSGKAHLRSMLEDKVGMGLDGK